jgi:hypothetical protein
MTNRKPGAATIYCPPLEGGSTYSLGKRSAVMPDSASINFYTRTCLEFRYWPYPVLFLTDGLQDTHNVRSVAFHPCGDYLLAGFLYTFPYAHFSSSSYCATCLLLAVWSNKLTSSAETPVASKLYFALCCFVFHNLDWCHSLVYITCVMLDFLCAGTDHPIPHLYDVSTFQCYLSSSLQDSHVGGSINQVFCPQMYWFLPSWKAC